MTTRGKANHCAAYATRGLVWLVIVATALLPGCRAPMPMDTASAWNSLDGSTVPPHAEMQLEGPQFSQGQPVVAGETMPSSGTMVEESGAMIEEAGPPDPLQQVPNELSRVAMPTYRVEPPDILLIDAVKVVPKEPYHLEPLDIVQIEVDGAPPERPITGAYPIGASGSVDLGPPYGLVRLAGKTLQEAKEAIEAHLEANVLRDAVATVSLAEPAAKQAIIGEHLVGPDGYVNLGNYGQVYVAGMTLDEVEAALEEHLSDFLEEPEITADLQAYNSKFYYLIVQGSNQGDGVSRAPITGNETVLDALADVGGLSSTSDRLRVWVARPTPGDSGQDQILPVDYAAIVRYGDPSTNYQLLPGDRIYVAEDRISAFEAVLGRLTQPIERIFGFTLLGAQSVQTMNRFPQGFRGQQFF